ncbi:MAG: AraC family transcriptional regulator [Clostridiaceae bacterium]|jgi:AraC-like DNA-binding protein|nr:AraC family transcriptional regulator [Clostridiaceae bacterium]
MGDSSLTQAFCECKREKRPPALQGEIIFHKPKEFHNIWANGKVAPNLIVIAFECSSRAFSRHFKKATGMAPSQYSSSVKIKL